MATSEKSRLRARLKTKRDTLTLAESKRAATRVLAHWKRQNRRAAKVLLYAAIQNEIPTEIFFDFFIKRNIPVYFPKIESTQLEFFRVLEWNQLEPARFILSPDGTTEKFASSQDAVAFVPGLAFSFQGHRLGFGRGFYDRFFSDYPEILRVGLAYDFQISEAWPQELHDQVMDLVLTPAAMLGSDTQCLRLKSYF